MALDPSAWESALRPLLSSGLKGIYRQMHSGDMLKDDDWLAEQIADLLAAAIASTGTGQIKTAGVPAGSVLIGAADGVPNPSEINVE